MTTLPLSRRRLFRACRHLVIAIAAVGNAVRCVVALNAHDAAWVLVSGAGFVAALLAWALTPPFID